MLNIHHMHQGRQAMILRQKVIVVAPLSAADNLVGKSGDVWSTPQSQFRLGFPTAQGMHIVGSQTVLLRDDASGILQLVA